MATRIKTTAMRTKRLIPAVVARRHVDHCNEMAVDLVHGRAQVVGLGDVRTEFGCAGWPRRTGERSSAGSTQSGRPGRLRRSPATSRSASTTKPPGGETESGLGWVGSLTLYDATGVTLPSAHERIRSRESIAVDPLRAFFRSLLTVTLRIRQKR